MSTDIDSGRLSTALQDIYAATLEPEARPLLPQKLAKAFGASSCLIHTRDGGPAGVTIIGGTDNCTAFLPAYVEYYHAQDEWTEQAAMRCGRAILGDELLPESELLEREWYNDLLRRHEIHHLVGAVFELEQAAVGAIGIHRPAGAAGFGSRDRAMLDLLVPHLKQALRLIRNLETNERARRLGFETLAAMGVGVLVVDSARLVKMMNAAAERLIRSGIGATVSHGRLVLNDARLDIRVAAAIGRVSKAPLGRSLFPGETFVTRDREGTPVTLLVAPLPAQAAPTGSLEPLAAIFIGDPCSKLALPIELVRSGYGLTPAEGRLLAAVIDGKRPEDYAAETGLSRNTVHTQMKAIFAKTQSHSQTELVRKIMSRPLLRLAD